MFDVTPCLAPHTRFKDEPGRTLADFLRQAAPKDVAARWAKLG
jgi:hypothetical protein